MSGVLIVDAVCVVLLVVGPTGRLPWLGLVPALALLVAMIPVVTAATRAANAAS